MQEAAEYFTRVWGPSTCESVFPHVEGRAPVSSRPFPRDEVMKRLKKFENTAPGEDGLTYNHWKRLDPECTVVTEVLNICLKHRRIPTTWKQAVTVLIFKKGEKEYIANWRPILCRTIYKLFAGCLAARLTELLLTNDVLNPCQKGFLPSDGTFEHVHSVLEKARSNRSDKCVAWLDVIVKSCDLAQSPTLLLRQRFATVVLGKIYYTSSGTYMMVRRRRFVSPRAESMRSQFYLVFDKVAY